MAAVLDYAMRVSILEEEQKQMKLNERMTADDQALNEAIMQSLYDQNGHHHQQQQQGSYNNSGYGYSNSYDGSPDYGGHGGVASEPSSHANSPRRFR